MTTLTKTHCDVHIRWQIRRDLGEVLNIEGHSFDHPWDEEKFIEHLRQRNCISMVAEHDERIVGYMLYELHKPMLKLLNFAVHPAYRRQDVGLQMIAKLTGKLSEQRRNRIECEVRETNLTAQLFFRACGFRSTHVMTQFYDDTGEDAYAFTYRLS